MLVTLSAIASEQSKPTDETMNKCKQFLNYVATHPNAIITFIQSKSDMVLAVSSNAHRISSNQKSTKPSRRTFLHVKRHAVPTKQNGAILNIAQIIKSVMTSAAEAEMGALYINAREAIPMRITLEEMGHRQPPTPMQTDNTTALAVITKRGLQDVTGVGYFHVTLTWGITRLQKICTEPHLFPVFAGGKFSAMPFKLKFELPP